MNDFAGLEGARGTAWESLAASEKIALACAFIQEEDGLLALKFLARVMASFGGSQGDCLSWHDWTRGYYVRQQHAQPHKTDSLQVH